MRVRSLDAPGPSDGLPKASRVAGVAFHLSGMAMEVLPSRWVGLGKGEGMGILKLYLLSSDTIKENAPFL